MVKDCFTICAYGRTELAQLYSPNILPQSACRKLMRWIKRCPGLWERLDAMGAWDSRDFTPAAVCVIVEALGEP